MRLEKPETRETRDSCLAKCNMLHLKCSNSIAQFSLDRVQGGIKIYIASDLLEESAKYLECAQGDVRYLLSVVESKARVIPEILSGQCTTSDEPMLLQIAGPIFMLEHQDLLFVLGAIARKEFKVLGFYGKDSMPEWNSTKEWLVLDFLHSSYLPIPYGII